MISEEHFTRRTGKAPVQDDLERSNCPKVGQIGHGQCGWDAEFDLPNFIVGTDREFFRRALLRFYP